MKRIVSVIVILFLIVSLLSVGIYADGAVPEEVLEAVNSVVRIIAEYNDGYATGSGFVIQSDSNATLIATNHHVIEDNPKAISIWTESGIKVAVTVLADDPERDLCILQLPYPNAALKALVLDEASVKRGDAVYAVGFPGAADDLTLSEAYSSEAATITTGIISTIRTTHAIEGGREFRLLQSTAPINHGNSGGPLFNNRGHVVGVNTYSVHDSTGIYGAVHVGELIDFAVTNGITIQIPQSSSDLSPSLIIGVVSCLLLLLIAIVLFVILKKRRKKNQQKEVQVQVDDAKVMDATQETDTGVSIEKQTSIEKKAKKRFHIKPRYVIATVTALLLIGLSILSYLYISHYHNSIQVADNGSFSEAEDCLILPFITNLHDPTFVDYLEAGKALENGHYEEAKEAFSKLSGYKNSDTYVLEAAYRNGIELLSNGEFDAAVEAFTELSKVDYEDSEEMILEAKYLQAKDVLYIDEDYPGAFEMLNALGDYSDAKQTMEDCLFLWAADYLEKQDLLNALNILEYGKENPKIKNEIDGLKDTIYHEAISYYRSNNEDELFDAFIMFYVLFPYERSNDYIALLKEKNDMFDWEKSDSDSWWDSYKKENNITLESFYEKCKAKGITMKGKNTSLEEKYMPEKVVYQIEQKKDADKIPHSYSDLVKLLSFEDAASIILDNYTEEFLTGTWRSSDGLMYFTMNDNSNHSISYNLPWIDFGDHYRIENGIILKFYEKDEDDTRKLFRIQIVDKDVIIVYCFKDSSEYRLTRR